MSDVNRRLLQFIDPNQFKNQNINKISDFVPKTVNSRLEKKALKADSCFPGRENVLNKQMKWNSSIVQKPMGLIKSFTTFKLKPELLRGLQELGLRAPTTLQDASLPAMLSEAPAKNVIIQSLPHTGKTIALIVSMLNRIDASRNYPQAIYLCPTQEAAVQTGQIVSQLARFMSIKLRYAVHQNEVPRGAKLDDHILIGTPGKILDWDVKFKAFHVQDISVFILDEVGAMYSIQGHQDQCIRIHKRLSPHCQVIFSSVFSNHVDIKDLESVVANAVVIQHEAKSESLDKIQQFYAHCKNSEEKFQTIRDILDAGANMIDKTVIFCQTTQNAFWLTRKLLDDSRIVKLLADQLTDDQRLAVMQKFQNDGDILVATNSASVADTCFQHVNLIIHFDLPMDDLKRADCETYQSHVDSLENSMHVNGTIINLVDSVKSREICRTIELHLNYTINSHDTSDDMMD